MARVTTLGTMARTKKQKPTSLLQRIARISGTVLMGLGVLALIWGFVIWRWGDPVTGLYTRWQQHQLAGELAVVEHKYRPAPPPTAASPATPAPDPDPKAVAARIRRNARELRTTTGAGKPLGRIHVSRLGLNMILVDGTDHDSLVKGPGVDRRTYLPGEGQLVYIAGHRTTFGAPFARIDRLRKGDEIELDMPYGRFIYRVSSHVIVPADDVARLISHGHEEIALQACHPRFSARERYIVYAVPVSGTVT
jgi:sortase A